MNENYNEILISAVRNCDFQQVKYAVANGADVNYLKRTNQNCWYAGDGNTPLSIALGGDFEKNEELFLKIVEYLIDQGSQIDVNLSRRNWHRSSHKNILSELYFVISIMKSNQNKIRLLKIIKKKADINRICSYGSGRNFNYYKPFLVLMMEQLGIKLANFETLQTYNFDNHKKQRQAYFQQLFKKQHPQSVIQFNQRQLYTKREPKLQQNYLEYIKQLIGLGALVHQSYTSETTPYHPSDFSESSESECQDDYTQKLKVSPLHIAIANNLPDLVELLISHSADLKQKCAYTLRTPLFAHEWPEELKQRKIEKNLDKLKRNERQKHQNEIKYQKQTGQEQKSQYRQQIDWNNFNIFEAKRCNVEDELPLIKYQHFEVTPRQLATNFKVSDSIMIMIQHLSN